MAQASSEKPLVSIVTVVCNGEKTLEMAIQSVISQTYDNIEYIIIDGASADGTLDIIKKYEDKVAYWVSEPDKGISDGLNKGIKMCKGELIGILHSDDWYEEYAVGAVVNAYISDKSINVIHGDLRFHYVDRLPLVLSPCLNPQKIWFGMIYNHPTCFVARKLYEQFGYFDESLKVALDHELLLRFYIKAAKFYYIPKVLANIRTGGTSDKHAIVGLKETRRVLIKYGCSVSKANFWFILKVVSEIIMICLLGNNRRLLHALQGLLRKRRYGIK